MTGLVQEKASSIGRYRVGPLLGRGGMADVYACVDERDGRDVAVKVLRDIGPSDAGQRSAEVQFLAELRHPHLVELLDAGSHEGREFVVMPLVEGPTLGQLCREGPLPLVRTGQIGAAVADGLAYIHAEGVVHRDVKPDNVLLGPSTQVRLADFGIARLISATRVTQTGLMVGTANYLAPEQVNGAHIGAPTDVYALGLVLLECLTGRREYQGTPVEAALARLQRRPQIPHDLPGGWSALLNAMTATEPAERPAASTAAGALHELVANPWAGAAALEAAIGAPLLVVATPAHRATPASTSTATTATGEPARLLSAPPDRNTRRWRPRLLALAAASAVVLAPAAILASRALLPGNAGGQPTGTTQPPSAHDTPAPPVTAPAGASQTDATPGQRPATRQPAKSSIGTGSGRGASPQATSPSAGSHPTGTRATGASIPSSGMKTTVPVLPRGLVGVPQPAQPPAATAPAPTAPAATAPAATAPAPTAPAPTAPAATPPAPTPPAATPPAATPPAATPPAATPPAATAPAATAPAPTAPAPTARSRGHRARNVRPANAH